jgi:hypothetical protein
MWHNAQECRPFFVESADIFVENAQNLHFIKENKKRNGKIRFFFEIKNQFS